MVSPFPKNPLGGNLGFRTASFYRLDPLGLVPVEPLLDIVPALNPARVTIDAIGSESRDLSFQITTNALQDFTSAQSNNHEDLERATISGVLISAVDLGPAGAAGLAGLRADLLKVDNLRAMAKRREPIMVVTPRIDMPRAFIEGISQSWDPDLGENTEVSISLVEARIVNPLAADSAIPDVEASATGNNVLAAVGPQGGAPVTTQSVTNSPVAGVAPTVVGVA